MRIQNDKRLRPGFLHTLQNQGRWREEGGGGRREEGGGRKGEGKCVFVCLCLSVPVCLPVSAPGAVPTQPAPACLGFEQPKQFNLKTLFQECDPRSFDVSSSGRIRETYLYFSFVTLRIGFRKVGGVT